MSVTDDIDPTEEIVLCGFHPKPFRWEEINPAQVVVSFDRRSDTLLIHLFGRDCGSISVHMANYLYVMVDPDTEESLGFHIEGFVGQAVKDVPVAIELLDYGELRGITPAEVRELQRETLGEDYQGPAHLRATNGMSMSEQWMEEVASFIRAEQSCWKLSFDPTE
jgi:hypothetical protein